MTDQDALKKIVELCKPGQTLDISAAIDLICDVYNVAKAQIPKDFWEPTSGGTMSIRTDKT